jgi:hypothetical protein
VKATWNGPPECRATSERAVGALCDRETVMRAVHAANGFHADCARQVDGAAIPSAPASKGHRVCADEGVLAEPRKRRTAGRCEEHKTGIAETFGLGRRDRPGAAEQLDWGRVDRMDSDATGHAPAERRPQLGVRSRSHCRSGQSEHASEDRQQQSTHAYIITRRGLPQDRRTRSSSSAQPNKVTPTRLRPSFRAPTHTCR